MKTRLLQFSAIAKLKANGFKWAPSQGTWQRQRTPNAVRAAESVLGVKMAPPAVEAAPEAAEEAEFGPATPTPLDEAGPADKGQPAVTAGQAVAEAPAWKSADGRTWFTEAEAKKTGLAYYNIEPDEDGLNDLPTDQEREKLQRGKVVDIEAEILRNPPAPEGGPAASGLHLPFFAIALCLPSCQSGQPIDEARLARIGDVALTVAERTGKISPEDVALAREAGKLLLTPAKAPVAETATK